MNTNPLISNILPLKHQNNSTDALNLLTRAAILVFPIMKSYGWKVKTLREFLPSNPRLLGLNVNRGVEIKIRLRPHHSQNTFYPFDHILGTLLHELVHNRISPHNHAFHSLLNRLWYQVDALRSQGLTGLGHTLASTSSSKHVFSSSSGNTLNGNTSARQASVNAARSRQNSGFSSCGHVLGGTHANSLLSPRQAAGQAAQYRFMRASQCGTSLVHGAEDDVEFVGEHHVIVLDDDELDFRSGHCCTEIVVLSDTDSE